MYERDYSKCLESEYKGKFYRSLTEAKWAAYFDYVGMPFIYEPESFYFSSIYSFRRKTYTPDFYLPEQDTYVEIKYSNVNDDNGSAIDKIQYLAHATGKMCLIIDKPPQKGLIYVYSPHDAYPHPNESKVNSSDYSYHPSPIYENSWRPLYSENSIIHKIIESAIDYSESAPTQNITQEMYDAFDDNFRYVINNRKIYEIDYFLDA